MNGASQPWELRALTDMAAKLTKNKLQGFFLRIINSKDDNYMPDSGST
jgi:hypothetical protein